MCKTTVDKCNREGDLEEKVINDNLTEINSCNIKIFLACCVFTLISIQESELFHTVHLQMHSYSFNIKSSFLTSNDTVMN